MYLFGTKGPHLFLVRLTLTGNRNIFWEDTDSLIMFQTVS